MISLQIGSFNKRNNSIKKPNLQSFTTLNGLLREDTSILSPIVLIEQSALINVNIYECNYAYIPSFKRYYFIYDVVSYNNMWVLHLGVDVLATYSEDILSSSQYVIRSTNRYNPNIIDSAYITENVDIANRSVSIKYAGATLSGVLYPYGVRYRVLNSDSGGFVSNYFDSNIEEGEYVIGVIGNDNVGINYYALSYNALKELIRECFNKRPSDMTDVSSGIANALYDPIQYITSCRWYPAVVSKSVTPLANVYIGSYEIPMTNSVYPINIKKIPEFYLDIDLPVHPNANEYPYLKLSPYSEYNLFFQPFGNIPIDSSKIYGDDKLHIRWSVDYATGMSHLKVMQYSRAVDNDSIIYDSIGDYGVLIPVSALTMDVKTGLLISGATWFTNIIDKFAANMNGDGSVMQHSQYANAINAGMNLGKPIQAVHTQYANARAAGIDIGKPMVSGEKIKVGVGNIANSVSDVIDKAKDILGSYMGQIKTVGTNGSFLAYNGGVPYTYAYFFKQTDKDPNRFGRPYYKIDNLSNIQGFCVCKNANINFSYKSPTIDEYNSVISLMNSGFYIE